MATESVTLDEATAGKLTAANGAPIPLCNPTGEVIGYYFTPAQRAKADEEHRAVVAWLDSIWPPEAIARIRERLKDKTRPKHTTEEVLRLVEGK